MVDSDEEWHLLPPDSDACDTPRVGRSWVPTSDCIRHKDASSLRHAVGKKLSIIQGRILGDVAVFFTLFSLRTLITPLWTSQFIPVVSPVFWQGHRWSENSVRTSAIIAHILSGGLMLLCAAAQFDSGLRRSRPRLHRWTGRCYVVSGCACVGALRYLCLRWGKVKGLDPTQVW